MGRLHERGLPPRSPYHLTGRGPRTEKSSPREVEVVYPDYQPSKAELEEDVRAETTFDEPVDALSQPVNIRYIDLTAGGLWRRLKLGALDAVGTSIDPAAAVHAGLTISGGPENDMGALNVYGGLLIGRHDWRYFTAGLSWQF